MNTDDESELSLAEQHAIRSYLLKLFAIPAVVISVLSFALGYGFQKEAEANALTEAMKILPRIADANAAAQVASDRASTAKSNTEKVLADATKLFNDLKQQDDLQKALHQTDNLLASLAKTLMDDPSFRQQIIAAAQKDSVHFVRYGDPISIETHEGPNPNRWLSHGEVAPSDAAGGHVKYYPLGDPALKADSQFVIHKGGAGENLEVANGIH